jgi:hypothetical protein
MTYPDDGFVREAGRCCSKLNSEISSNVPVIDSLYYPV